MAETNGTDASELLTGMSSSDRNKEWGVKKKPNGEGSNAGNQELSQITAEHFVMNVVRGGELVQVDMTSQWRRQQLDAGRTENLGAGRSCQCLAVDDHDDRSGAGRHRPHP